MNFMPRHVLAKGRLPPGEMNKTEAAYDIRLDALRHHGEILWYKFAAIKLRLAPNCFLTVDFPVLAADGVLEMHDVKGHARIYTDDAKAKMKVAASMFPFRFKVAYPLSKKDGGGWRVEDV